MSVAKAPADIDFGDQYSLSTSSTVINPATWCARNAKRSAQLVILRKKLTKQKTSTLAAPDPFQPSSSTRKIGENKLLSARARAAPYAKPGAGVNKGKVNPYGGKCLDCKVSPLSACGREYIADEKQPVAQNSATRCQKCAYKKGLCAICGTMVLDTTSKLSGLRALRSQLTDRISAVSKVGVSSAVIVA